MRKARRGSDFDAVPQCMGTPCWAVAPCLVIAALWLNAAAQGPGVLPGDVAITRAVQAISWPIVDEMAGAANWVGGGSRPAYFAALVGIAFGLAGRFASAAVVAALLAANATNALLKTAIESPRPMPELVRVTEDAPGYGFPSGHVMSACLVYGGLVYLAREHVGRVRLRRFLQVLAGGMIALTGFGRIYVGAHWPSDVLGGYLWGGAFLLLVVAAHSAGRASVVRFRASRRPALPVAEDASLLRGPAAYNPGDVRSRAAMGTPIADGIDPRLAGRPD